MLDRIGDKWSMLMIVKLATQSQRFSELLWALQVSCLSLARVKAGRTDTVITSPAASPPLVGRIYHSGDAPQ